MLARKLVVALALPLAAAVGACRSASVTAPPATGVTAEKPAALRVRAPNAVCPEQLWHYDWKRELFPGCPPGPFPWVGTICVNGTCPKPCREISVESGYEQPFESRHMYEDGRWTLSSRGASLAKDAGEHAANA